VARRRQTLGVVARQLETLMGRYPSAAATASGTLVRELPAIPAGLPAQLLSRRPDLAAAERRLAAAGCRVDSARAALYPRLSLTASGGTNSSDAGDIVDDDFRVWSIGSNLLQPIFRGGALRAEVRRNEAAQFQAIADYGALSLRAFAEVENALDGMRWLQEQQQAVRAAATASARARDLARERYQSGLADFLTVQDSQQRAFVAESSLLTVQRLCIDNRIDLVLALGGGFETVAPNIEATPAATTAKKEQP
jgi:NodT family efflux transporter outer membrane factor (OMF) lipoprotein